MTNSEIQNKLEGRKPNAISPAFELRASCVLRSSPLVVSCWVLLGPLVACPGAFAAAPRPNIIVLLADDLGYAELGCQGNEEIPTPHIDSLARNGVRLTSGHVSAPVCCPSRAGLMTGRYQTRFGHELNAIGRQNLDPAIGLPLSEKTLADHLREAGYATGLVGKWHLGGTETFHPQRRGFDEFFGFTHEGHFFVPGPPWQGVLTWMRTNAAQAGFAGRRQIGDVIWSTHLPGNEPPYDADNPILRGTQPVNESEYLTDAFTREAVAFIERHKARPFFLHLAYNAVHSPMQAPLRHLDRFRHMEDVHRRLFAAMLSALDDSVGTVLAKLRERGLTDNTLIFFLSDNGGPTAELTSSNAPLRGGKGQLWEGGIRVPFLVQWKARLPAGVTYEHPVIALDILPTALDAAGVSLPNTAALDGVSLLPYLRGERHSAPHPTLFWRYGANIAVREGSWKLVRQGERGAGAPALKLFNLAADIGETFDQSHREPDVFARLKSRMDRLNGGMAAPLWGASAR